MQLQNKKSSFSTWASGTLCITINMIDMVVKYHKFSVESVGIPQTRESLTGYAFQYRALFPGTVVIHTKKSYNSIKTRLAVN